MKDLFKGYYRLSDEEFKTLWNNAIFVFDTNVLLNLYRYQSSTRDSLLNVIEKLAERIWIPYHVGLEYQRNRLKVISAQHKRYDEVKNIVSKSLSTMENELEELQLKKRHTHINPDSLIAGIKKIKGEFLSELAKLEEKSINVNSIDKIRERVDILFQSKIGSPPSNQEEINSLFNEAEERYKKEIPPGFEDSNKNDNSSVEFTYGGILYKRKYGDFIVWKQLLIHAEKNHLKDVIFVTDDNKSDWWWKVDNKGMKTIGVRPELTDEIIREAKVERFFAYNTEGFLNYANQLLDAKVTEEAIEEVREVAINRRIRSGDTRAFMKLAMSAERAVYNWLKSKFSNIESNRSSFPDFIAHQDNLKYGFEVKLVREPRVLLHRFKDLFYQAFYELSKDKYNEITIIFAVLDEDMIQEIIHLIEKRAPKVEGNIRVIVGKVETDEDENSLYGFTQYADLRFNE